MTTLLNVMVFGIDNARRILAATIYFDIVLALMLMEINKTVQW